MASEKRVREISRMHPKNVCREIGLKHHSTLVSFVNTAQVYPSLAALATSLEMANWFYVSSGFSSVSASQVSNRLGRSRMSTHRDISALIDGNYWVRSEKSGHLGTSRYTLTPLQFALLEEFIKANSQAEYLGSRIVKDASCPASSFRGSIMDSPDDYAESV